MNWKRGVLIGTGLYAASFIIGMLLILVSANIDVNNPIILVGGLVGLTVLTALFSLWYFMKARAGWKEGLFLGLLFIVVGVVLDLIFIIIGGIINPSLFGEAFNYYISWQFWVSIVLVLLASTGVSYWKDNKSMRKRR